MNDVANVDIDFRHVAAHLGVNIDHLVRLKLSGESQDMEMSPRCAVATFAEGNVAPCASDLPSEVWQATILAVSGNANPMAKIEGASFRMS